MDRWDGIGLDHRVFCRPAEERAATVWLTLKWLGGACPKHKSHTSPTRLDPHRSPLNTAHQINLMLTSSDVVTLYSWSRLASVGATPTWALPEYHSRASSHETPAVIPTCKELYKKNIFKVESFYLNPFFLVTLLMLLMIISLCTFSLSHFKVMFILLNKA